MLENTDFADPALLVASSPTFASDIAPLAWLCENMQSGHAGALVTIVGIDGGAPRPVGTQMAVLADGRFSGQLSGGCVEPAIAAEALEVLARGSDAVLRFGKGAKAIDIRFPCGGGVDVLVHIPDSVAPLAEALELSRARKPFHLALERSGATTVSAPGGATGWDGERFVRPFLPRTRSLLVGRGQELEAVARSAFVAGHEVRIASPAMESVADLAPFCAEARHLTTPDAAWQLPIDPWTATVLLFHEHNWEQTILMRALDADGFYIGALGSRKTHRHRIEALASRGADRVSLDRIRGPIGLIPQARDPQTLAISILAEIAAERARVFG